METLANCVFHSQCCQSWRELKRCLEDLSLKFPGKQIDLALIIGDFEDDDLFKEEDLKDTVLAIAKEIPTEKEK